MADHSYSFITWNLGIQLFFFVPEAWKVLVPFFRGGYGGGCSGAHPPLRWPAVFLYNWYSAKKKTMWFTRVEVEQETSAPPPKKNPGSAPAFWVEPPCIGHYREYSPTSEIFSAFRSKTFGTRCKQAMDITKQQQQQQQNNKAPQAWFSFTRP